MDCCIDVSIVYQPQYTPQPAHAPFQKKGDGRGGSSHITIASSSQLLPLILTLIPLGTLSLKLSSVTILVHRSSSSFMSSSSSIALRRSSSAFIAAPRRGRFDAVFVERLDFTGVVLRERRARQRNEDSNQQPDEGASVAGRVSSTGLHRASFVGRETGLRETRLGRGRRIPSLQARVRVCRENTRGSGSVCR